MKTLNAQIRAYTNAVRLGDMPAAYRGILAFMGELRADFARRCPGCEAGGLYPGHMDMSYFALSTKPLKEKGLKLAVVYLHEKGAFEVWLSARNRALARRYRRGLDGALAEMPALFFDENNPDAVVACTLTAAPDFDSPALLTREIEKGVEKFAAAIADFI